MSDIIDMFYEASVFHHHDIGRGSPESYVSPDSRVMGLTRSSHHHDIGRWDATIAILVKESSITTIS